MAEGGRALSEFDNQSPTCFGNGIWGNLLVNCKCRMCRVLAQERESYSIREVKRRKGKSFGLSFHKGVLKGEADSL